MGWLLGLLCGLFVIAGVGHVLWLLAAAVIRVVAGIGAAPVPTKVVTTCPGCGRGVQSWEPACPGCGLKQPAATAHELKDLESAGRQLERFRASGALEEAACEAFRKCLENRRRELSTPQAAELPELAAVSPEKHRYGVQTERQAQVPASVPSIALKPLPEVMRQSVPALPAEPLSDVPVEPEPAVPPRPPRRKVGDLLAGFMEERNILWGELVGGLLIVGCSIALVITLWHSLEAIPYFPFLIIATVTAALFGAGEYTLHHWKLASTSRGLLVIALMLVPLNLLVLADPSAGPTGGALDLAVRALALLGFAGLIRAAGRDLIGTDVLPGPVDRRWLLTLAVLGAAGSQLLIPRQAHADVTVLFALLAWLPAACHVVALGAVVAGAQRRLRLGGWPAAGDNPLSPAYALFVFLGIATFALAVALGFLLTRSADLEAALQTLAGPVAVAGSVVLAAGVLVQKHLSGVEGGAVRTAGTGVALTGTAMMLGALVLAWPLPYAVLLVCLLDGVVLTMAALRGGLSLAQAGAIPCFGLAYVAVFHLLAGHLSLTDGNNLAALLVGRQSGPALVAFTLVLGLVGEAMARAGRSDVGGNYAVGAGATALVSLTLVTGHGRELPGTAAIVFVLYGAGTLAATMRWPRAALPYAGLGLVVAGSLWTLQWGWPNEGSWWSCVVATESLFLALSALVLGRTARNGAAAQFRAACRDGAAAAGLLALGMALFTTDFPVRLAHTATAGVLAASALVLASVHREPRLTSAGSALVLVALYLGLVHDLGVDRLPAPFLVTLLVHATLALGVSLVLKFACGVRGSTERSDLPLTLYGGPLYVSSRVVSIAAVPVLLFVYTSTAALPLAADAAWLGALWLVVAWVELSPRWFTACQAAFSDAVLWGATAWVQRQAWIETSPFGFMDPRARIAYCFGLGLLGLIWLTGRLVLGRTRTTPKWWDTPGIALDHVLLGGVVVLQMVQAAWGVAPGVVQELTPAGTPVGPFAPEHVYAFGVGAWLLLSLVAVLLGLTLWQRGRAFGVQQALAAGLGLVAVAVTAAVLAAGPFEAAQATASALRWALAGCCLACTLAVGFGTRATPLAGSTEIKIGREIRLADATRTGLDTVSLVVVLLTLVTALPVISGENLAGPAPESVFARMGWVPSIVVPLVLLVAGFAGHAWRERSAGHAFAAGLTANLAATLVVSYTRRDASGLDWLAPLVQVNVVTSAASALAWQAVRRRLENAGPGGGLLELQSWLGLLVNALFLTLLFVGLFLEPDVRHASRVVVGGAGGWLALGLSAVAAWDFLRVTAATGRCHVLGILGMSAGVLAACGVAPWDTGFNWLSFHVLLTAWSLFGLTAAVGGMMAFVLARSGPASDRSQSIAIRLPGFLQPQAYRAWLEGLVLAIVALGLRAVWQSPYRPYSAAAALLVASVLEMMLAIWFGRARYVYASGLLLNGVGLVIWVDRGTQSLEGFLWSNVHGLAIGAFVWALLEGMLTRRIPDWGATSARAVRVLPYAHFAGCLALALAATVVGLSLASDLSGGVAETADILAWTALLSLALGLAASLWDRSAHFPVPGLYVWGLIGIGLGLHALQRGSATLGWAAGLTLAGYVLLTSMAARWPELWAFLHLPERGKAHWFLPAQAVLASLVIGLSIWMCLDFDSRADRMAGPLAMVVIAAAGVPLTGWALEKQKNCLRCVTLALGVIAVAEAAWAVPTPVGQGLWLNRNGLLLAALAATASLFGTGLLLPRVSQWSQQARRLGPLLNLLAVAVLLFLLLQEAQLYDRVARHTPMDRPVVVVVVAAVLLLVAIALRSAMVLGRDPFGLSERGRTLYVYAAEVLLVLLFVHLRLNVPELFSGWLARYWALIVMTLAFAGTGLGEFFERRGLRVLAEPLQRSGVFLPLVPLLSFWVRPPEALAVFADDTWPTNLGGYGTLWLLVALLYGAVALTRKSFLFALLAALAGNGALWSLLAHRDLSFLVHPQLWLIPLGLIVLGAEASNRNRLRPEVSDGLRYLGILLIYVSSTADHFIAGVGNSAVMPVVLALLSVAGVLAGILLQVRSFLFLGVGFLGLDIFTMIWHAAVHRQQAWVWWVCGIILGAAILALFTLFEKRRDDMLRLLEEVRRWD